MEKRMMLFHHIRGSAWAGIFLLLTGIQMACHPSQNREIPPSSSQKRYLGFDPPGEEGRIFAPGVISSKMDEHSAPAIAPDGHEIFWSVFNESDKRMEIKTATREEGVWSPPETADFSGIFWDDSPVFSPDGAKLFFCSKRPADADALPRNDQDIWVLHRQETGWSQPERLSFNTEQAESWCSAAANGNLYFTAVYHDSLGKGDLYIAKNIGGAYAKPVNIGAPVNARSNEMTPYIAPDESFLIFASTERYLGDGLYLCFRKATGAWTEPVLINNLLNPVSFKRHPGISPDGRFLFYVARVKDDARREIFWVGTDIIAEFKSRTDLQ